MKIETKYNTDAIHFCIYGNEIKKIRITKIQIKIGEYTSIIYTCVDVNDLDEMYFRLNEYEIYKSKEELLKFIKSSMEEIDNGIQEKI